MLEQSHFQNSNLATDRLSDSINYFLTEISGKIQLKKTKREKAEAHYEAIAKVLKDSPPGTLLNKLDIKMIPFGGLGTNTAVHPLLNDEFDLDLIIKFFTTVDTFKDGNRLFYEVFNRLSNNDTYKDKIEPKSRCVRVNYSGDFHLDLMPAVPYSFHNDEATKLWIPEDQDDSKNYELITSDPIGIMSWFEGKCDIQQKTFVLNEATDRGDFEAMPLLTEDAKKPPLKQAVQLFKRCRDDYFKDDKDCRKILKSILILTVAGECYAGETNVYVIIKKIITVLDQKLSNLAVSRVNNPKDESEDFLQSVKDNSERATKLREFLSYFKNCWIDLLNPTKDLAYRHDLLKQLFGETVTQEVFNEYGQRMDEMARKNQIRMAAGGALVTSSSKASLPLKRHEFFGDL